MDAPDRVPTGLGRIERPQDVAVCFGGLSGLFENANVGLRIYDLLQQAARDKALGQGGNFHTAKCQLRQLCDAQRRSDIVLCPRITPDAMTVAYVEHVAPGSSSAQALASGYACLLTLMVSLPPPTRQEVRLIMGASDDGVLAASVKALERPGAGREDVPLRLADPTACLMCAKPAPEKTCARCRLARYCGTACQRAHWPEHKKACASRESAGGSAVAASGPSVTIMVGEPPRTEAEREAVLRQLNMQGDASSVCFFDTEDLVPHPKMRK